MKASKQLKWALTAVAMAAGVLGCAAVQQASAPSDAEVAAVMKSSFKTKGIASVDRLNQTELQAACSAHAGKELPPTLRAKLEKDMQASIRYPSDGKYLGDWKEGEKIAQSGRGLQFSDDTKTVSGGNCYACHQLAPQEVSFGNIGPSLHHYGKLRGDGEAILRYTWGKIYNSHAFMPCSNMPRFGEAGILTEQQMRDVLALLLDPQSPVNK
jgi:sulfur-oxidizing protein SoxX